MNYSYRLSRSHVVVYSFFAAVLLATVGCSNPFTLEFAGGGFHDPTSGDGLADPGSDPTADPAADPEPAPQPGPSPDPALPQLLVVRGENFTLAWDGGPEPVAEYRAYTRQHGTVEWTQIAAGLEAASISIDTTILAYGVYEFAVSSVAADGTESDLHTSLDPTADPGTGWYLSWEAEA